VVIIDIGIQTYLGSSSQIFTSLLGTRAVGSGGVYVRVRNGEVMGKPDLGGGGGRLGVITWSETVNAVRAS
jgi:hypothetical protein